MHISWRCLSVFTILKSCAMKIVTDSTGYILHMIFLFTYPAKSNTFFFSKFVLKPYDDVTLKYLLLK